MPGNSAPIRHPVQRPVALAAFPFGVEFQRSLIRLLGEDSGFANAAMPHLEPGYFENEVLAWCYGVMVGYREKYNAVPSLRVIMAEAGKLDSQVREFYRLTIEQIGQADLSAEPWLRDQTLDFIKRNIYVRAHQVSTAAFNGGDVSKAYEVSMQAADQILNTDWESPDREFFFENFAQRQSQRLSEDPMADSIATGIHELDHVLGGGLSKGEMGIWLAHSKRGKTTMLANHGVQAVRRGGHNVLHLVFEGARRQVANRYDTIFAQESYHAVRAGGISSERFQALQYEYQMYSRKLVLRGFTERWDYTVQDISEEMRELKRLYGWEPDLIIVDYLDLLRGRGAFRTETQHQTAASRDLKTLANRGYAVWTACQPQRPKVDPDLKEELLSSLNIADAYAKIRVADFIGSLNQTKEERDALQMRLWAELYRDNAAGQVIHVHANFDHMTISGIRDPATMVLPSPIHTPVPLGYVSGKTLKQLKGPL